jgi:hypothetical protein
MTSKGNEELAKKMQEAFKKAGVSVGADTIAKVLEDDCGNCHSNGCRDGCDDGCMESCEPGNR